MKTGACPRPHYFYVTGSDPSKLSHAIWVLQTPPPMPATAPGVPVCMTSSFLAPSLVQCKCISSKVLRKGGERKLKSVSTRMATNPSTPGFLPLCNVILPSSHQQAGPLSSPWTLG